jgi:ADP-heptose:LPS heptosyltransferase
MILLGGKEDRERGDKVVELAGSGVYNACGSFSLQQSASLVRQAWAVLTNDTGLMHIAAAFNKPTVSVWGNTIPAFGMYPYLPAENPSPSMIAEVRYLSCRPCSKIGFRECPKKHFKCMNDIDNETIVAFLKSNFH